MQEREQQQFVADDVEQKEQDDIAWMFAENSIWNEQSAKFRSGVFRFGGRVLISRQNIYLISLEWLSYQYPY